MIELEEGNPINLCIVWIKLCALLNIKVAMRLQFSSNTLTAPVA
jgi:hypothetical protein